MHDDCWSHNTGEFPWICIIIGYVFETAKLKDFGVFRLNPTHAYLCVRFLTSTAILHATIVLAAGSFAITEVLAIDCYGVTPPAITDRHHPQGLSLTPIQG